MSWQMYFIVLFFLAAAGCCFWGIRLFLREKFMAGCTVMLAAPIAIAGLIWFATLVLGLAIYGV